MLVRRPVRLDDVSDLVREQLFDVDLEGNDLNVWLYNTARLARILYRNSHHGL